MMKRMMIKMRMIRMMQRMMMMMMMIKMRMMRMMKRMMMMMMMMMGKVIVNVYGIKK